MNWVSICNDPLLANLPYKIQTDKWGNVLMSPASNEHGIYQAKLITLLSRMIESGAVIAECSVQTTEGVKVADMAWASDEFMQRNKNKTPFLESPELCVEIISRSNTKAEMEEKKGLYFAKGCIEFWLCDKKGRVTFYKNTGKIEQSALFPAFQKQIAPY